jgi:hypothetical protein
MSGNFYAAIASFGVTILVTLVGGGFEQSRQGSAGLVAGGVRLPISYTRVTATFAMIVLGVCVLVNVLLR